MEFNLYTVSSSGSSEWTEDYLNNASQGVTVKNGYFSVQLGSLSSFPGTIKWDQEQWLGMTVRGTNSCTPFSSCASPADGEMTPRFKLTAVPYAFKAQSANNVASNDETAVSTNSGAISIKSGNAGGATSNSGNIAIDAGTATGTAGTISLGASNASSLLLGRASFTTTNVGNLTVQGGTTTLGTSSQAGGLVVSDGSNSTITLKSATQVAATNYDITVPAITANDTLCLVTLANCSGAAGGGIANQTTLQSTANYYIQSAATGSITARLKQIGSQTADILTVEASGSTTALSGIDAAGNFYLGSTASLKVTGAATGSRPGSPTEGQVFYDTTTKQLIVYANGKWQSDRQTAKIVASTTSSQNDQDSADYVANGENSSGSGTGSIDGDQIEINSALSAVSSAGGGVVYLMEGTYTIDASISIPNNVTLAGSGQSTIIQLGNFGATSTSIDMIVNTDTSTGTNVGIRDLKLDGRNDRNSSGTQRGINMTAIGSNANTRKGGFFDNITVTRTKNDAMTLTNSGSTQISKATVFSNTGNGLSLSGTSYISVKDSNFRSNSVGISVTSTSNLNSFTGNVLQANSYGIQLSSSNSNTIANNTVDSNTVTGIDLAGNNNAVTGNSLTSNTSYGVSVAGLYQTVSGNTITGGAYGVYITSSGYDSITGNAIYSTNYGVYSTNGNTNTISSNTFRTIANNAINLTGSSNNTVSANTITDSGGSTNNDGIVFISTSTYNNVTGNYIYDNSCTINCYAISIPSGSSSDYNYLASNYYSASSGTASINDGVTTTRYGGQTASQNALDILFQQPNSTTALTVKNGSGNQVLTVDTTNGQAVLGKASTLSGKLVFSQSSSANAVTLQAPTGALGGNYTLTIPTLTASANLCTDNSVCTGYAPSATNGYVQLAPSSAQTDTTTNSSIYINKTGASGNILQLQKSGSDVLSVANNGQTLLQPTSTSTSTTEQGIRSVLTTAPTSASTAYTRAIEGLNLSATSNTSGATLVGVYGEARSVNGGNVGTAIGGNFAVSTVNLGGGAATIANGYGVYVQNVQNTGSTITKASGIAIENQTAATNNTNLLLGTGTIPTGNYSIYNSSSYANYLGGNLAVQTQTNSSTALQVQDAAGFNGLTVDTTNTLNLLTNPGFEVNTTGWAGLGSGTVARNTTQLLSGSASMAVTTTAAASDGAKAPYALASTTTYTFSFYARLTSGTMTTLQAGRSDDGSTNTTCTLSATTLSNTGWNRYYCTFTTGTTSGSPYVFIRQSDAAARTIYIDDVQLETGSTATNFKGVGAIAIDSIVNRPLLVTPAADTTDALVVTNAAGTSKFSIDTLNGQATNIVGFAPTSGTNFNGSLNGYLSYQGISSAGDVVSVNGTAIPTFGAAGYGSTTLIGVKGQAANSGDSVQSTIGVLGTNTSLYSGTVTNSYDFYARAVSSVGGTVTNDAGLAIENQAIATNNTNLLLGTGTIPAGNYSIYNSSAYQNVINGNLRVGSTSNPTVALDVTGSAAISGTLAVNTITPTGAFTVGATGQSFTLQGTNASTITAANGGNTTTLGFTTPTANQTYNLPNSAAGTYTICTTANNCVGLGATINNQATLQSTANFNIQTGTTTNDTAVIRQLTSQTGQLLRVVRSDGTTNVFTVDGASGASGHRQITDSATAFQVQNASATTVLDVDTSNSRVGINTTAPSADLTFGDGANRTVNVLARTTAGNGYDLTIAAGAGNTANNTGGNLVLQGGVGVGTGAQGAVKIGATAYTAASTQSITGSVSVTQANLDSFTTIPISANAAGYTLTVPTPGINVVGRIAYITNVGSFSFILLGTPISPNVTATIVWNGSQWTYAGADGTSILNQSATAQSANFNIQSASSSTVGAVIQGASSQSADLLDLRDSTGANLLSVSAAGNLDTAGYISNPYGGIGPYENRLTFSEDLNNAAWTATSLTAPAANTQTSPLGTTTAESLATTGSGGNLGETSATAPGATYTFSVWVKSTGGTQVGALRINGATTGTGTAQTFTATTTWQRVSVTQNTTGFTGNVRAVIYPGGIAGTGTIYAWGAQLAAGTSPLAYVHTDENTVIIGSGLLGNAGGQAGLVSNGAVTINDTNGSNVSVGVFGTGTGTGLLRVQAYGTGSNTFEVRDANNSIFTTSITSGNSVFSYSLNVAGKLLIGSTGTATADLSFANGSNRTINVMTPGSAGNGNNLTVTAAAANGANTGGQLSLQGGAASATSGSNGGAVLLAGADGTATSTGGSGGAVTIQGGAATSSGNHTGGNVSVTAGASTGNSTGGTLTVASGAGGATGTGGSISITSGAGGSTSGNSGNITINTGGVTSGTKGTIGIGNTNASALTLGNTGASFILQGTSASTLTGTNSGSTTTFGFTTPTANQTYNLPNSSAGTYTICTTASANCSTAGSGYVQFAPSSVQVDAGTNSSIFVNKTGASGKVIQLQSGGSDVFVINKDATATIGSLATGMTGAGGTALQVQADPFPSSASVGTYAGINSGLTTAANSNLTGATLLAVNGFTSGLISGTVGTAIGAKFYNSYSAPAIATNAYGLQVDTNTGIGTNNVGIAINPQSGATNNTNLLIGTFTVPSGNYSIYNSSSNQNVIGGNLRVGSTSDPTVALDVTGAGKISTTLTVNTSVLTPYIDTIATGAAAITRTNRTAAQSSTSYGTASYTPAGTFTPGANKVLVAYIFAEENNLGTLAADGSDLTISGGGLTWTAVGGKVYNQAFDVGYRVYYAVTGGSPSAMQVTADAGAFSIYKYHVVVDEYSNVSTSTPVTGFVGATRTTNGNDTWTATLGVTPSAADWKVEIGATDIDGAPSGWAVPAGYSNAFTSNYTPDNTVNYQTGSFSTNLNFVAGPSGLSSIGTAYGGFILKAATSSDLNVATSTSTGVQIGNTTNNTPVAINNGTNTTTINSASTTAFTVQNSSTAFLTVDTTSSFNQRLGSVRIGNTDANATLLVLDTRNSSAGNIDPDTGINGGMYYNSYLNSFRCYENGSWKSCISGLTDQDEWWVRPSGTTAAATAFNATGIQDVNAATNGSPTYTVNNSSDSILTQGVTGASSGNTAGFVSTAFNVIRTGYNPVCTAVVRTGASISTDARVFVGLIDGTPANANDTGGNHIGFRFSSHTGDTGANTGWHATTRDGTTNTIGASNVGSSANLTANTTYTLKMRVDRVNGNVYMSVNGGTEEDVFSNFPASGTDLGFASLITNSDTNADTFNFGRFYCEFN